MTRRRRLERRRFAGAALVLLLASCGQERAPEEPPAERAAASESVEDGASLSPTAQPELTAELQLAANQPRHASDGGGRAWLEQQEGDPDHAIVLTRGRFTLVFEVGPEGIAVGGTIHFQVSPFWGWSTPQVEQPDAIGYTLVEPGSDDMQLVPSTLEEQLRSPSPAPLILRVEGRPLRGGERIRFVYGAGPQGAETDRMVERNSRFWFAVDGDGDGVREFLPDSPGIDVRAGAAARLVVHLPSIARPGEKIRATIAVLDASGSTGVEVDDEVSLVVPEELELPQAVRLEPGDLGRTTIEGTALQPGLVRLRAEVAGLTAESNPMWVQAEGPRIFWGDLHGHSGLSDGTGTVEDYFVYGRDVAALDVISLTDHDHWGIQALDSHPEMWADISEQTQRFHAPGRFVTLLGFEWTSWLHGHRHVLYFEDEGEVYSSIDPDYAHPTQLWDALRDQPALTFAHHSAGGPIATNWSIPPDPVLEPLTEIVSVHGSSEALDAPVAIYSPVPGNFVRDALDRGYRFGFVGSGDSHDGHPGLAHLLSPTGGMAAILASELTREAILEALRARRVYATNGPRILLRTALGAHPMGSIVPAQGEVVSAELFIQVVAVTPLERVDLIRSGEVIDSFPAEGDLEVTLQRPVEALKPGEYVYVRAVQIDGGAAWSSPIYVESQP